MMILPLRLQLLARIVRFGRFKLPDGGQLCRVSGLEKAQIADIAESRKTIVQHLSNLQGVMIGPAVVGTETGSGNDSGG